MSAISSRPLDGDADWWRLRDLLIEIAGITPAGFCWDVRRLDGDRFYNADPGASPDWRRVHLWETAGGRLVVAVHGKGGWAHLQVHPAFRTLEEQMLAWAETGLSAPSPTEGRELRLYVFDHDESRQALVESRGYEQTASWGMTRRMRMGDGSLLVPEVATGYVLRPTRPDHEDAGRIAGLLNAAFGRTFHTAEEYETFRRLAPCFQPDLDLVAVAPDGTFAAYVGVPFDPVSRRGIFEPVCTHPEHRRRGLAQALMREGLLRLRARGAVDVVVDTGDMEAANALYESLGFTEAYRGAVWRRAL